MSTPPRAPRTSRGARARGALAAATVLACAALPFAGSCDDASRRTHTVTTTRDIAATPARVWRALASYDALPGRALALAALGLPEPRRCTLEREAVGAKRTCWFDVGHIEERVVVWDPPRRMELEITEVDLPATRWIGFERAVYTLDDDGHGGARVSRATTIRSSLAPSLYFAPIEALGLALEHDRLLGAVRDSCQEEPR
jgi:uncharacterized protein YndB with AHSA1/START domain